MTRSVWTRSLFVALVSPLVFIIACTPKEPIEGGSPPIILISLDTLRADVIGRSWVNGGSLTPHLDAFAADAVTFTQVIAPMPFTLPSHMTMLTGLHPEVHGVSTQSSRLGEHVPILAERLRDAGYRTAGLVTNNWMKGSFGFSRGFDTYKKLSPGLVESTEVNRRSYQFIAARSPQPLFLFLHYFDAHSDFSQGGTTLPYYSPPAYRKHISDSLDDEQFCTQLGDGERACATRYLQEIEKHSSDVSEEKVRLLRALYDSGVRYLDEDLGRLFSVLRTHDLYDRSVIIVVSDHGEEFLEHGRFIHSQPYEESVRVPLLIKLPDGQYAGATREGLVELADLMPTILDLVELEVPPDLQGVSLLPMVRDEREVRKVAISQDKRRRSRWALRTKRFKLIWDSRDDATELYDLREDPGETVNLASRRSELATRMRSELESIRKFESSFWKAHGNSDEESVLTEAERRQLRALGYLD